MTTHETDRPQEAAEAEEAEPVAGYFDQDDAAASDDTDDTDGDEIDTAGLADPDADVAAEAEALDDPATEVEDEPEPVAEDGPASEPIALGPPDADAPAGDDTIHDLVATEDADTADLAGDVEGAGEDLGAAGVTTVDETAAPGGAEESDELAAEPVVVELDETEVEVLDEPVDDTVDDGDESVLLTESASGSVLPPPEEGAAVVEDETAAGEPGPVELLEPVGPDAPIDPGTGSYRERWSAIQGSFVDEPFRAVESAGALVAQIWHEYERSIAQQRDALDSAWTTGSSTDDLRAAFRQYRELFNRLTALLSAD
jgi:hypothetical protein